MPPPSAFGNQIMNRTLPVDFSQTSKNFRPASGRQILEWVLPPPSDFCHPRLFSVPPPLATEEGGPALWRLFVDALTGPPALGQSSLFLRRTRSPHQLRCYLSLVIPLPIHIILSRPTPSRPRCSPPRESSTGSSTRPSAGSSRSSTRAVWRQCCSLTTSPTGAAG